MSRAATLATMKARAVFLADMPTPSSLTFVTDTMWTDLINRKMTEVWDALISKSSTERYAARATFNVLKGTSSYALPVNLRSVTDVFALDPNTGRQVPMQSIDASGMSQVIAPTVNSTLIMEYIPNPPFLSDPADTFDGINGWEELISALAAEEAMLKEESDPSGLQAIIAPLRARINSVNTAVVRGPRVIRNVRADEDRGPWASRYWGATPFPLLGYRIFGQNVEFYAPLYGAVA